MDKLTIEHLSCYLPYGLNINCFFKNENGKLEFEKTGILIGILSETAPGREYPIKVKTKSHPESKFWSELAYTWNEVKPLLRPMKDIDSYLNEHTGIEIDSSILSYNKSCNSINIYPDGSEWTHSADVYNNIYVWLFKNHFDVFGLIDKNLAIPLTHEPI